MSVGIDFTHVDQNAPAIPNYNSDVAYLRRHAKTFVTKIDAQERLNTTHALALPAGTWNMAFVLLPANIVLKISPWDDLFEADFLRLAATVHAPTPACISYGAVPDAALPNASYVLMQHIEQVQTAGSLFDQGQLDGAALRSIGRRLGSVLAQLHTLAFPFVRSFNDTRSNWGTCLGLWALTETPLFDAGLLAQFSAFLERARYRERTCGALTHSDANLHNILVDSQTHDFRALIDPGPQITGLPMHDLAVAAQPWVFGEEYQHALLDGYRAAGGSFDEELFNLSLLCIGYHFSKYYTRPIDTLGMHLRTRVLPALA
jgi:hypothetical protein